jgi:hypothetical protein
MAICFRPRKLIANFWWRSGGPYPGGRATGRACHDGRPRQTRTVPNRGKLVRTGRTNLPKFLPGRGATPRRPSARSNSRKVPPGLCAGAAMRSIKVLDSALSQRPVTI